MKNLKHFFNAPFPYFKNKWQIIIITSLWVFAVFAILRPFGLNFVSYRNFVITYFTIAAVFATAIPTYVFPLIFKKFYLPENWTRGKYFIFSFTITSLMVISGLIYFNFFFPEEIKCSRPFLGNSLFISIISFIVSIFPTTVIYFITDRSKSTQISDNNLDADKKITETITLTSSRKDKLTIDPSEFLYAEVVKNNVNIYYIKDNKTEVKSLRTTLSNVTENLTKYPQIMQCHRAFLINTSHVTHVSGNTHGYQLQIKDLNIRIPVSRTYAKEIKTALDIKS